MTLLDWSRVDRSGGLLACWPWLGGRLVPPFDYGIQWVQGRGTQRTHRLAFEDAHGRPPDPNCLHTCDNPPCANPLHLFEGTTADNNADARRKGRSSGNAQPGSMRVNAKLTEEQVVAIRAAHAAGNRTYKGLAYEYGVALMTVRGIVLRRTWTHVPEPTPAEQPS